MKKIYWPFPVVLLVALFLMLHGQAPVDHQASTAVIVVSGQSSAQRPAPDALPSHAAPRVQAPSRRQIELVTHTLEDEYPMINHASIACQESKCILTATLGDISNEGQANTFNVLMTSNIDLIFARNGFHMRERPVIETMGGVYTGFSVELDHS